MSRKILIVDDEPDFSELVQYRLAECGYEFQVVTNSTDALNCAWDSPPDLILLDLLLPDLDGLSVCEIFARHPATQHPGHHDHRLGQRGDTLLGTGGRSPPILFQTGGL